MTVRGFEPLTCCSGGSRSIQLSYTADGVILVGFGGGVKARRWDARGDPWGQRPQRVLGCVVAAGEPASAVCARETATVSDVLSVAGEFHAAAELLSSMPRR